MKRVTILLLAAIITIIVACNKVKHLADINVDIPYSHTVDIPKAVIDSGLPFPAGGIALPFQPFAVETNSKEYIAKYNTAVEKVQKVDLKSMNFEMTPTDRNFNFLDSVQLYISGVGLPEVLVAYQYNVPKNSNTLDLITVTNVNLKDYFVKDTMYFRINTHINAIPPTGEQIKISTVLHMLANPLE